MLHCWWLELQPTQWKQWKMNKLPHYGLKKMIQETQDWLSSTFNMVLLGQKWQCYHYRGSSWLPPPYYCFSLNFPKRNVNHLRNDPKLNYINLTQSVMELCLIPGPLMNICRDPTFSYQHFWHSPIMSLIFTIQRKCTTWYEWSLTKPELQIYSYRLWIIISDDKSWFLDCFCRVRWGFSHILFGCF